MAGLRCPCIPAGPAAAGTGAVSPQGPGDEAGSALEVAAETPQPPPHPCAGQPRPGGDTRGLWGLLFTRVWVEGGAGRGSGPGDPLSPSTGVSKLAPPCQRGDIPGMQPPPRFWFLHPGCWNCAWMGLVGKPQGTA